MGKPRKPHQRTITPADEAAAERLHARWKAHQRAHGGWPTQDQLAELWGEGANQSLMSQYLNGKLALNARAVRFFARVFGCLPTDIRDDLPELHAGPITPQEAAALRSGLLVVLDYLSDSIPGAAEGLTVRLRQSLGPSPEPDTLAAQLLTAAAPPVVGASSQSVPKSRTDAS